MKYIVVTGGVMSGIGKGITASSIGVILKKYGFGVTAIKIDPYLNQDAGTMSPMQHGECFVLSDGGETDLDLGNYERFLNTTLTKDHNITSGKIYKNVMNEERKGKYLGQTVQIIPHVTNEIRDWIFKTANKMYSTSLNTVDFCIIELGGTIGDIESLPYVEALRQIHQQDPDNVMFVHVSYLPILKSSNEIKTKPTQHGIKELKGLGINPDILCLRCEKISPDDNDSLVKKISWSCGVDEDNIVIMPDQSSIYKVPLLFDKCNMINKIRRKFKSDLKQIREIGNLKNWERFGTYIDNCKQNIEDADTIKIGIVGKYTKLEDSYLSIKHALEHAGFHLNKLINIEFIDASDYNRYNVLSYNDNDDKNIINKNLFIKNYHRVGDINMHDLYKKISTFNAIIIPGGFGDRGYKGMKNVITYCRISNIPILGICLGMQIMTLEIEHYIFNKEVYSAELSDPRYVPHDQCFIVKMDTLSADMGGTMRLGAKKTSINPNTNVYKLYEKFNMINKHSDGSEFIIERYRHRYEINPKYIDDYNKSLYVGNIGDRQCIIELDTHPFFIGCQFHPEYQTYPFKPHPLFVGLLEKAFEYDPSILVNKFIDEKNFEDK